MVDGPGPTDLGGRLGTGQAVDLEHLRIAAIVPCHNEEAAVAKVVRDLREAVPTMDVYVYDNRSTDDTQERAREAGATVRVEEVKGKGNVVRRAFGDLDADVYLLIDGDDTYDAFASSTMIRTLLQGPYDHVLGVRAPVIEASTAYRPGHERGNRLLNWIVGWAFGTNVGDMLSGYRVFSRRFVKSFPAVSREFEIETELTVHSLALRVPQTSIPVGFKDRPAGSESKLRTYRDGSRILKLIINLVRHERPVAFYGLIGAAIVAAAIILAFPVVVEYSRTGLVGRFPTLFLAFTMLLAGGLTLAAGLVLDGIRKSRHEQARLSYLQYAAVPPLVGQAAIGAVAPLAETEDGALDRLPP
jgi:glycosyltransferase involved in cell wall biosynthesis